MLFSCAPPSAIEGGILALDYKLLLTVKGGTVCVIIFFNDAFRPSQTMYEWLLICDNWINWPDFVGMMMIGLVGFHCIYFCKMKKSNWLSYL